MSLEAVCAHEAGHAAAAVFLNWTVNLVEVIENGGWKGRTSATPSNDTTRRKMAAYFAAGRAAEQALIGDFDHTRWEQDAQEIARLARQEIGGDPDIPEMILPAGDKRRISQFVKQAEDDAKELVRDYGHIISAVAAAIERYHKLDKELFAQVVTGGAETSDGKE